MAALLTDLQRDIANYMGQCSTLDHLNIVVDDMGTIDSTAEKAVKTVKSRAGTQGMAALVLRPSVSNTMGNVPGPQSEANITIQLVENVLVNRSQRGSKILSDDMGFRILSALHLWTIGSHSMSAEPNSMRPLPMPEGFVSYEISLKIMLYNPCTHKTIQPLIDNDAGTVTLTSSTPSSSLFYSLDGCYPHTEYTSPFTTESGDLVRAIATSPDLIPSSISELTIP